MAGDFSLLIRKENIMPTCCRCKKPIEDRAYIRINPEIVDTLHTDPLIYEGQEKRNLYSLKPELHDKCWVELCISFGLTTLRRP